MRIVFHNGRIHTQHQGLITDSFAIDGNEVVAVGYDLHKSPEFKSYAKHNLKGKSVVPGLTDAHTHFLYFALSYNRVILEGAKSIEDCQRTIKEFCKGKRQDEWIVGEGFSPDNFRTRREPSRDDLDAVTGSRPAFIFAKDHHTAWVNSAALKLAGITQHTPDIAGGEIIRDSGGTPTGILREHPVYLPVFNLIPQPTTKVIDSCYAKALHHAYRKGVTAVHSFDSNDMFSCYEHRAEKKTIGLRVNYYFRAEGLNDVIKSKMRFGTGDSFLRVAGIKIFADGTLGSQTALCFKPYIGGGKNCGIEVTSVKEMLRLGRSAAQLGLPCAVHAIGDKAVSNVLDVFAKLPKLSGGARHRIEHIQLIRRSDIKRMKSLGVIASMQPSHCTSDIAMIRKYWAKRQKDAYLFRTIDESGVPLCFGSDVPIEPLDPLAGIADAITRKKRGSRDVFHASERMTSQRALYAFTAGAAYAVGQEDCRGQLLPGYPADFVVLDGDFDRMTPAKLYKTPVLATFLDGNQVFAAPDFRL
jgi:predicted amidohydrolase YtcJ